jgi:hypothetical protein
MRTARAFDPFSGLSPITAGGRIDESQPVTASISSTRKLTLVLHNQADGSGQLVRGVTVPELHAAWVR